MKKQSAGTSRSLAINCLTQWSGTDKPIQHFIDTLIHSSELQTGDRQLAVMLVMGVLQRQQYLDTILSRFSKTPLRKMKPLTLAAMRIGIYQLCFLDRIPDSAAVNETVHALKKSRQPGWLLKFANGTLRAIAREKQTLSQPETAGPDNGPILEHPDWLTERWRRNFGLQKMQEICRINTLEPELCLHVNRSRTGTKELAELFARSSIASRAGKYAPDSLILPGHRGAVMALPGFNEGLFQIQDQAAQLSCLLMRPLIQGGCYLDGCAGLGGKTCSIAGLLPPEAILFAVEPDQRRTRLLADNLERQKLTAQVTIFHRNLQEFAASNPQPFDGILIDAPCSGTGVIRKQPDIRWNRHPENLAAYQAAQLSLLKTAASLLAPGGILIYATCSLEPEENEQVIEQFLASTAGFTLTNCRDFLPEGAAPLVNDNGFFKPLPAEEIEGFFAARMVRDAEIRNKE
jgi:16S rRNA (cytosine967-C5)-methyltransferase